VGIMSRSTTRQYNQKLEASLIYILEQIGDIEIMKLAKLLYLTDYLYAKTFGFKQGFMDGHVRYEFGPVPTDFYQVYDNLEVSGIVKKQVNTVTLLNRISTVSLNEDEIACLNKTLKHYGTERVNIVKEAAYKTEPMITIQLKEKNLGSGKLMYEKMDFSLIKTHPLFIHSDVDMSFKNDPAYLKNRV
jgi:uncharacterized phage-associated protein